MHLADNTNLVGGILGGLLIGATSSSLLLLTGRLTGISGIVEDTCICKSGEMKWWTWLYNGGLVISGVALGAHYPEVFGSDSSTESLKPMFLIIGGALSGFGTRLGSGCTSGHGISGLSRLSVRSLVAVLTFMTTGSIAATLSRSEAYKSVFYSAGPEAVLNLGPHVIVPTAVTAVLAIALSSWKSGVTHPILDPSTPSTSTSSHAILDGVSSFASALVFGLGLGVGGMLQRSRVQGFLDFLGSSGWDYSLAGVMGAGVLLKMGIIMWARENDHKAAFCPQKKAIKESTKVGLVPANMKIDAALVTGAALFGLGWGLTGYCPGPALVNLGRGSQAAGLYVPSMLVGMLVQDMFSRPAAACAITEDAKAK